jgi:hypothetical protein
LENSFAVFLTSISRLLWRYRLLNVETLTLANVTGRLKAAEDELEAPPTSVNHAGKLYLLEEAWEEK